MVREAEEHAAEDKPAPRGGRDPQHGRAARLLDREADQGQRRQAARGRQDRGQGRRRRPQDGARGHRRRRGEGQAEALAKASQELGQAIYAQQAAARRRPAADRRHRRAERRRTGAADDDVVDAEVVDEDK